MLCHSYKLFERLILIRIAEHVNGKLIPWQARFRAGKSRTSQLLNLAQHIEDGYDNRLITGAVFVDPPAAAYDTGNHRRLLTTVLEMTGDVHRTDLIRAMLERRRFCLVLNGKKSRWQRQRNGLPQGGVLAPMLFNIYTNDQPVHTDTRSFIYADATCVSRPKETTFTTSKRHSRLLWPPWPPTRTPTNCARTRPRVRCALSTWAIKAKRELNVVWNGTRLSNTLTPSYLGVHLDRTLAYKAHIEKNRDESER